MKRTVPQVVFETKEALKAAKEGHAQACRELDKVPHHMVDEGNPNHPMYDLYLFGYHVDTFLAKQY
jgi:hypothetical protein